MLGTLLLILSATQLHHVLVPTVMGIFHRCCIYDMYGFSI